ncbi:RNA-binding cell elongation regulator Jag/EloR [Streptococcus intermedius]|uniref:RNA-binding protein KhpB n=1 Tax=Streptococcus intermedius TaxID=1338 RepID=A0A3R9RLE7_STRIT|nr:RNA-binding cell elongation regulator Jag/EloR [Streptococcus intermedius]MBF1712272.1 protein jag [Streptococcus intermedius]RSJ19953.1 R3H domain protein [Streptococcus intermedius]RSJ23861.1 R3H domain protein [Streptococcus intermedius]
MVLFTGASVEEAIQNGLRELDIPRMKAHIKVISREKKGFLGLFGKKLAQVDVEAINETTVVKANQRAVKGVPDIINAQNEPVKSVSEATVDLGHVVAAIKKIEEEGKEISDDVKAEILKHEKEASTILEETGTIDLLKDSDIVNFQKSVGQEEKPTDKIISFDQAAEKHSNTQPIDEESANFEDLGIQVEENYDLEEVVGSVTSYVQNIVDEMDVEASLASTHNRRTINMQIDTNEPGRIIGYHGKVLKALQLLAQNYLYNRYSKSFYISINVNDYVEHRAEVLQSYAQKLADRVLEYQHSQKTDPMSNNERKIIHRIVSKMDGLTSYSEGDEPNRYVVVDIDSE